MTHRLQIAFSTYRSSIALHLSTEQAHHIICRIFWNETWCAIFCVWFFELFSSSLLLLVVIQGFGRCILWPSSGVPCLSGHRNNSTWEIIFKVWPLIIFLERLVWSTVKLLKWFPSLNHFYAQINKEHMRKRPEDTAAETFCYY